MNATGGATWYLTWWELSPTASRKWWASLCRGVVQDSKVFAWKGGMAGKEGVGPGHQMLLLAKLEWALAGEATHPWQESFSLSSSSTVCQWVSRNPPPPKKGKTFIWQENYSYFFLIWSPTFGWGGVSLSFPHLPGAHWIHWKLRLGAMVDKVGDLETNLKISGHPTQPVQCNKSNVGKPRNRHWMLRVGLLCLSNWSIFNFMSSCFLTFFWGDCKV